MSDVKRAELIPSEVDDPGAERQEQGAEIASGQWYWYRTEDGDGADLEGWLGCVLHVGSNYARLESPDGGGVRVHFDQWDDRCTFDPNPQTYIQERVLEHRQEAARLMERIRAVCRRLGVSPRQGLPGSVAQPGSTALATISQAPDPNDYKAALVKAKDVELPELFKALEAEHKNLATWLKADLLPLRSQLDSMKAVTEEIEGRVFNVSLYAGLVEEAVQIRKGKPASYDEKLHVLQRRRYMDEECLLAYEHGGMEFGNLREFDRWLAKRTNRDRLFPFPRCMVAFRVRRHEKTRYAVTALDAFVNINLAELDTLTFLYVRNGGRLYRINTELKFAATIFPDRHEFDLTQAHWVILHRYRTRVEIADMISNDDYEERISDWEENRRAAERWKRENPLRAWCKANRKKLGKRIAKSLDRDAWNSANPYLTGWLGRALPEHPSKRYTRFAPSSVYYDDCIAEIGDQVKHYNRVALIIQGLFDRSDMLHPHPPVETWKPEGFAAAVELVYDGSDVLYDGERPPDWEAYRERLRAQLGPGSVTIGQHTAWLSREQTKEYHRRCANWRYRSNECRPGEWWKPFGDPGPGELAVVARWSKKKAEATYRWHRERQREGWAGDTYKKAGDPIPATIKVPARDLFNVSAYQPGDYLQFFSDPRTRADYLQWAPILLLAEEYHAGNRQAQEPVE